MIKTIFYPYVKSYRWRSIFFKYFITFLLAIAIPFTALTVSIFSYFSRTYRKDIKSSLESSVASYVYSVENILNNVNTNTNLISSNNYVLTYIVSTDNNVSNLYFYNLAQRVSELFNHYLISNEYLHSIQLYNKTNGNILSFGENKSFDYAYLFDKYFKLNKPNCTLGHSFINNNTTIRTITFYREIYLSSESIGVLAINLNADKIFGKLAKQSSDSIENIALLNETGDVLYSFNEDYTESIFRDTTNPTTEKSTIIHSDSKHYYLSAELSNAPYTLSVIFANNNHLLTYLWLLELLCIVIMLVISFILAYKLSTYFYNSLAGILTIIENSPDSDIKATATDEFNFLSNSILNILQKNKQIEQELIEKTLSFRRAQMQALQMQINPHFIFNTLQLASTMSIAILKKDTAVNQILSQLAELIYAVYQTEDYLIPLEQEIQYAKNYMEIQQIRYSNSFSVKWEINEDTLNCHIIKFSLQPILENAIVHGLSPIEYKGRIKVSARRQGDNLLISISNDGVGMDYEALSNLRNSLTLNELTEGKGIGLRNTQQRIQNVFGPEYGITIDSGSFGTTITITVPCI